MQAAELTISVPAQRGRTSKLAAIATAVTALLLAIAGTVAIAANVLRDDDGYFTWPTETFTSGGYAVAMKTVDISDAPQWAFSDAGLDSVRVKPSRSLRGHRSFSLRGERAVTERPVRWMIGAASLVVVGLAGVLGFTYWNRIDWRSFATWPPAPASPVAPMAREMPPLPRRGETVLARATLLAAGGHLRDALTLLDAIRPTDPQKPGADRLRAQIQRQLLAVASGTLPGAADRDNGRLP